MSVNWIEMGVQTLLSTVKDVLPIAVAWTAWPLSTLTLLGLLGVGSAAALVAGLRSGGRRRKKVG